MFGETTISYVKIGNHPIETTIYKWLFGVPGKYEGLQVSWDSRLAGVKGTSVHFLLGGVLCSYPTPKKKVTRSWCQRIFDHEFEGYMNQRLFQHTFGTLNLYQKAKEGFLS